jgi:alkylation response protein AidB-like acyl-CoA dehydrogenase
MLLATTYHKPPPQTLTSLYLCCYGTDLFQSPDYFGIDELLTEEQKLIRETVRNYVKKEISPIIEDFAQRAEFPEQIVKQLGDLGCFGPTVPRSMAVAVLIISATVL